MHVEIRTKHLTLTDAIRLHIERRLGFALDRFARSLRTVLVWVGDINGRKGGDSDKCCRMAVELSHGTVVLEERAADLYVAIDRAAHRVARKVAREVKGTYRPASPRREAV